MKSFNKSIIIILSRSKIFDQHHAIFKMCHQHFIQFQNPLIIKSNHFSTLIQILDQHQVVFNRTRVKKNYNKMDEK